MPFEAYFGRGRSESMRSHLQSIAREVGLTMQQRDVIINSRRALGAAEFARENGKFEEMHLALFKAHWEGGGRLENVDDLVRIGEGVGPPRCRVGWNQRHSRAHLRPALSRARRPAV